MRIINLTRHEIRVIDRYGDTIQMYDPLPKEKPALTDFYQHIGSLDGIPLYAFVEGDVKYLPGEKPGVYYIVNMLTFLHPFTKERHDLLTMLPSRLNGRTENNVVTVTSFLTRP